MTTPFPDEKKTEEAGYVGVDPAIDSDAAPEYLINALVQEGEFIPIYSPQYTLLIIGNRSFS
jgi:hypothetical protein